MDRALTLDKDRMSNGSFSDTYERVGISAFSLDSRGHSNQYKNKMPCCIIRDCQIRIYKVICLNVNHKLPNDYENSFIYHLNQT